MRNHKSEAASWSEPTDTNLTVFETSSETERSHEVASIPPTSRVEEQSLRSVRDCVHLPSPSPLDTPREAAHEPLERTNLAGDDEPETSHVRSETSTNTTRVTSSLLSANQPPLSVRIRKRDILVCHILLVVTSLVTAVMNTAITIFAMGVGIGLILGDTLRPAASAQSAGLVAGISSVVAVSTIQHSSEMEVVRRASATCRTTVRRYSTTPATPALLQASEGDDFMPPAQ